MLAMQANVYNESPVEASPIRYHLCSTRWPLPGADSCFLALPEGRVTGARLWFIFRMLPFCPAGEIFPASRQELLQIRSQEEVAQDGEGLP